MGLIIGVGVLLVIICLILEDALGMRKKIKQE